MKSSYMEKITGQWRTDKNCKIVKGFNLFLRTDLPPRPAHYNQVDISKHVSQWKDSDTKNLSVTSANSVKMYYFSLQTQILS